MNVHLNNTLIAACEALSRGPGKTTHRPQKAWDKHICCFKPQSLLGHHQKLIQYSLLFSKWMLFRRSSPNNGVSYSFPNQQLSRFCLNIFRDGELPFHRAAHWGVRQVSMLSSSTLLREIHCADTAHDMPWIPGMLFCQSWTIPNGEQPMSACSITEGLEGNDVTGP